MENVEWGTERVETRWDIIVILWLSLMNCNNDKFTSYTNHCIFSGCINKWKWFPLFAYFNFTFKIYILCLWSFYFWWHRIASHYILLSLSHTYHIQYNRKFKRLSHRASARTHVRKWWMFQVDFLPKWKSIWVKMVDN